MWSRLANAFRDARLRAGARWSCPLGRAEVDLEACLRCRWLCQRAPDHLRVSGRDMRIDWERLRSI